MATSKRAGRAVSLAIVGAAVLALLYMEVAKPTFSANPVTQGLITMTLTRSIGAVVFLVVLLTLGYRVVNPLAKPMGRALLFCMPAALVAINNAPLLGLAWGQVTVTGTAGQIGWFVAESLAIGLFEELAFRGVALLVITERRHATRMELFRGIVLSSAVFGLLHLTNLLTSSPGAVFLQMGYSFLIGAMCAMVLFKTANIWLCVLLHAVYDVGGNMLGKIAEGRMWNTPTVVITAVLGVATAVFYVVAFLRMKPEEVKRIWGE